MEGIPQPSRDSYTVDDRLEIFVRSDDVDDRFHGTDCEVGEVHSDDHDVETGRTTDTYPYSLRAVTSDDVLPISFRHHDLVPAGDEQ